MNPGFGNVPLAFAAVLLATSPALAQIPETKGQIPPASSRVPWLTVGGGIGTWQQPWDLNREAGLLAVASIEVPPFEHLTVQADAAATHLGWAAGFSVLG
jgi:hypothetical protein